MATTGHQTNDPAQAQGAQIPLENFNIPAFPPEAGSLKALTLTADLKLDEYQEELSKSYSIPRLPPLIESLTLELFHLGYPPGFLAELATRVPNVKSLVVYAQLLGGISDESQGDAVNFFRGLPGLRALHLLDVFARQGFFTIAGPYLTYDAEKERRGLMFLEVNYTTHPEDEEFLSKVPAAELPALIGPGLITLALNVSAAEEDEDEDDPSKQRVQEVGEDGAEIKDDGIMTFNKTLAPKLVSALTDEKTAPVNLRVLNMTLYTLTFANLKTILAKQPNLMVAMVTLEVSDADICRTRLIELLESYAQKIEQLEVVVSPDLQFFMQINKVPSDALEKAVPSKSDLEALGAKCPNLANFKANVLRSTRLATVDWQKKDGKWEGGAKAASSTIKTS